MTGINFQRTYLLDEQYANIKERAVRLLNKYLAYPDLFVFDDQKRQISFSSEKLIPAFTSPRPRVLLLFSNPHPYSVQQGMFLSPDIYGHEHPFWPLMRAAGWIKISEDIQQPKQLAEICLQGNYAGPFELIFYCFFAFPTQFPEDIRRIFGREYFRQVIEPEAQAEFMQIVPETGAQAVVTFNKNIFNRVSKDKIERYVDRLKQGELIQSQLMGSEKSLPVFLTFPTGWRFSYQSGQLRRASLDAIRQAIQAEFNAE